MKRVHKQFAIVAMAVVLGTALIGSAYTLWFEDLELHADVTTGELDGWIICGTGVVDNDGFDINGDWLSDPGFPLANIFGYPHADPLKDVGQVTKAENDGDHTYLIEIVNAYPGYAVDCELELRNQNGGTIPWHVETLEIMVRKTLPNGDVIELVGPVVCDPFPGDCVWGTEPFEPPPTAFDPNSSQISVVVPNFQGCQVHPGDEVDGSLIIGVNQAAMEGSKYEIWIKFQINQWNESGWSGCGQQTGPPVLPPV